MPTRYRTYPTRFRSESSRLDSGTIPIRSDQIRSRSVHVPTRPDQIQIWQRSDQTRYKSDPDKFRSDQIQIWSDQNSIRSRSDLMRQDLIRSRSDLDPIRFRSDTESIKSNQSKTSEHAQLQVKPDKVRKLIKYRKWIQFFRLWELTFANSLQSFDTNYCIHFIHFTQNTKLHLRHPNTSTDLLTDRINQMTSLKWMKWIQYSDQCNIAQSWFETKPT